ncbi:MAG: type-F conjugative transfer system secretin TraK [bacterium]|nr:type-F conjugative transfer system secretin TraK [bacterium]
MNLFRRLLILAIFLGVFSIEEAYSSNVEYRDNGAIAVRLKADTITEAEFPADIANVTKSVPSQLLQIETLGNRMFLLARENFESSIYVVTQDNFSYSLRLTVGEAQAPSHIKIKKPDEDVKEPQGKAAANTIELMKSLINDRPFQGVVGSKLPSQEIFNDGRIRIVIDKIYEFQGGVKAVVLTFENLLSKPVVMPIENVELPGLLAISVKSQMLEARPRNINKKTLNHTTKVYMVVEGINR